MSIESDLYTRLSNHAGLSALVGARIYPLRDNRGNTFPCVVWQRITTTYVPAMGADRPDTSARFQFDCFASTFDGARAVATQLRAALQRYQGGGIVDAFILNENDFYESDAELFRTQLDFKIHFLT